MFINQIVSIFLALVTRNEVYDDRPLFHQVNGDCIGNIPHILVQIWNRAMMTEKEYADFLEDAYKSWKDLYYGKEDKTFFEFFTKERIRKIIQLQKEWVDPEIDLKEKLVRIISFLAHHLGCVTPKQTFLLLLNCLCSNSFHFDRKMVCSKKKKTGDLYDFLEVHKQKIRVQSFIFNLLNSHPALCEEIKHLGGNDEVMFDSAKTGFRLLTDLFLNQEIPDKIVSLSIQQQICGSTCFLFFFSYQELQLAKQVLQKFRSAHPRFRRFLIGRSHIILVLVWRMFHMDRINKLRRIPNSFVAKSMMTIGIFPEFVPSNHFTRWFLSLPIHTK
jgi:hypothetical protein